MEDIPKDNFTQVHNKLLEALAFYDFSSREYKILIAVIRLTLGYRIRSTEISIGTLARMTGIDRAHISRSLNSLIEKNVVRIYKEHTKSSPREIGINLIIQQWAGNIPEADAIKTETKQEPKQSAIIPITEVQKPETKNPTVDDCIEYFLAHNESKEFGELFFHKHESTNWKDGSERIITNWKSRAKQCMLNPTLRQSILGDGGNGQRKTNDIRRSDKSGIEYNKYEELYRSSQNY